MSKHNGSRHSSAHNFAQINADIIKFSFREDRFNYLINLTINYLILRLSRVIRKNNFVIKILESRKSVTINLKLNIKDINK